MKVESKLKNHKGYIILPDFLTLSQVRAFEDAFFGEQAVDKDTTLYSVSVERMLPFILENVKEWHLEGVPDKPTGEEVRYKVVMWVSRQFNKLWQDELDIPNE